MVDVKSKGRIILAAFIIAGLAGVVAFSFGRPKSQVKFVRVLSYSAFLNSWGPAKEIARLFHEKTGFEVEYIDAGDAGLLLKKLELFPSDVVIGLDQLSIDQARGAHKWRPLQPLEPDAHHQPEFLAFDYGPMTFVYRDGEVRPPAQLDDLLKPEYKSAIALQDPRASTPGLQFFFWVLDLKGVEAGLEYLRSLKPNLQSVAPSWSGAYGIFTRGQAKLVFSYLTSPIYHWVIEEKREFKPVVLAEALPVQVEYVAVPEKCEHCEAGEAFARFLLEPDIQRVIMNKNFMLPVAKAVAEGTPFAQLPQVEEYRWKNLPELMKRRDELLDRWRQLGL